MEHLLSILLVLSTTVGQAQDLRSDLAGANALFDGVIRFKLDKDDRLIADFFDGSTHYRQDVVFVEYLAPETFAYNAEEQVVMLRCKDEQAQCIDKELFKLNTIRHTGRMNLPVPNGDPQGERSIAILADLVRHAQAAMAAMHETKSGTERRK
jgi:uncharacterized protein YciU (UPF0263 family)